MSDLLSSYDVKAASYAAYISAKEFWFGGENMSHLTTRERIEKDSNQDWCRFSPEEETYEQFLVPQLERFQRGEELLKTHQLVHTKSSPNPFPFGGWYYSNNVKCDKPVVSIAVSSDLYVNFDTYYSFKALVERVEK